MGHKVLFSEHVRSGLAYFVLFDEPLEFWSANNKDEDHLSIKNSSKRERESIISTGYTYRNRQEVKVVVENSWSLHFRKSAGTGPRVVDFLSGLSGKLSLKVSLDQ